MTKDEARQVVKILKTADGGCSFCVTELLAPACCCARNRYGGAILNAFTNGYATRSCISESSIKSLLGLNLIRQTSPFHYVLTNFGMMVKKKLEPCPF